MGLRRAFPIADRMIGTGRSFLIAEIGVNHNGSVGLAKDMVRAAAAAGADAVKFQAFRALELVTERAPKAAYQERGSAASESQLAMLQRLELTDDAHAELSDLARSLGVIFLSSVFDRKGLKLVQDLRLPAVKVPSGELTDHALLAAIGATKLPVALSTGMSTMKEVEEAVEVLRKNGCTQLVILHCVSAYPADPSDVNLRTLDTLRNTFKVPVGFSDHTLGTAVSLAAVAKGAAVIEKHFTTDRTLDGPDQAASATPVELAAICRGAREIEAAMGTGIKSPTEAERETMAVARKSVVAARDISAGERLDGSMVAIRRPGTGLPPSSLPSLLGKHVVRDIPRGAPIVAADLA